MRRPCLVFLVMLAACGARQPMEEEPPPTSEELPGDVEAAITGAVEQYRQAYEVHSMDALAALYHPTLDLNLVFQGHTYRGWTQVESFLSKRLKDATKVRITITGGSIQPLGSAAALFTAGLESTIGDEATSVTERGVLTLVFRHLEGKWLIVGEHFSYPAGGQ